MQKHINPIATYTHIHMCSTTNHFFAFLFFFPPPAFFSALCTRMYSIPFSIVCVSVCSGKLKMVAYTSVCSTHRLLSASFLARFARHSNEIPAVDSADPIMFFDSPLDTHC